MLLKYFLTDCLTGKHGHEQLQKDASGGTLAQEVVVPIKILVNFGSLAEVSGVPVVGDPS